MKKIVGMLVVAMVACPAMAGTIATPWISGDFTAPAWGGGEIQMIETGIGTDIWEATTSGLGAGVRHEFKVTQGDWGLSLPGANSWFNADGGGSIKITYDGNTYADGWLPITDRIGMDVDPGAWTAVGNWQNQLGGGDWDNASAFTSMTPMGGGIYHLQAVLAPGTNYEYKAVFTGSWDAIGTDSRTANAATWFFDTTAVLNTVDMWVNALDGSVKIEITPEPGTLALLAFGGLALIRRR